MKDQILLSIIIPHRNIHELLERCLVSIPDYDFIETIIIDDNSESLVRENFPGIGKKNTTVIFSEKNLGAGASRNIGLELAKGQWVLFADSDDFFHENLLEALKNYFHTELDLIYFGMNSVYSDTLLPAGRGGDIVSLLQLAKEGDGSAQEIIKYKFLYPSCKLIRRQLILDYNIRFDEVPASNDTMFGVKVGTFAQRVAYDPTIIYCLTSRVDSLVYSYKYANLKSRLLVSIDLFNFLEKIGKENYAQSSLTYWLKMRKINYFQMIRALPLLIKHYRFKAFYMDICSAVKYRISKPN